MVFIYMTQTAKLTSFTEDIAISVFIVAGSYEVGQLIVNQSIATWVNTGDINITQTRGVTGNPAIDWGLTVTFLFKDASAALAWVWLYPVVPFAGALLAVVFNELLYKKSLIQAEEIDEEIKEEAEIENNYDYDNTYQQEA